MSHQRADRDRLYVDEGDDVAGSARRAYADERIYRWLPASTAEIHASHIPGF